MSKTFDPFGDGLSGTTAELLDEPVPPTLPSIPERWWEPVHFSKLKWMAQCAALYEWHVKNPSDDTAWGRIGTAFHSLVLGGREVHLYEGRRSGKDWESFKRSHPGTILIHSEWAIANGMAESVKRHRRAMELIDACSSREIEVTGQLLGIPCAGRIDGDGTAHLIELKSDKVGQPERWQARAEFMGYAAQMDWYRSLIREPNKPCYCIVCEKQPPYLVVVHAPTERKLLKGRESWWAWIELLKTCAESNAWGGYCESDVTWDSMELEQGETIPFEESDEDAAE